MAMCANFKRFNNLKTGDATEMSGVGAAGAAGCVCVVVASLGRRLCGVWERVGLVAFGVGTGRKGSLCAYGLNGGCGGDDLKTNGGGGGPNNSRAICAAVASSFCEF